MVIFSKVLFSIILLAISISSFAQKTKTEIASEQTALIKHKLSLSDSIASKVEALELKYAGKKGEMIIDNDGKKTTLDGELKALFTHDQYKQYKDLKKEQEAESKKKKEDEKAQKEQNKMMKEMNKGSGRRK